MMKKQTVEQIQIRWRENDDNYQKEKKGKMKKRKNQANRKQT
jgi:hypothetical protein